MAYMNSTVTRGRGEMVVTATGMGTEVGQISGMLSGVQQEKTPLTRQLDQLDRADHDHGRRPRWRSWSSSGCSAATTSTSSS